MKKSESVKLAACPEVVRKTYQEQTAGKQLGRIYFATESEGSSYHAEITSKNDLRTQLTVGTDGKVIMQDEETTPDATPEGVKTTILAKPAGGTLENVYKITNAEDGVAYNARIVTVAQVAMDLSMDAEGKVVEITKAPE